MQAILYIALFIAAMQVIQQFTYPHVLFGVHLDEQLKAGEEITSTTGYGVLDLARLDTLLLLPCLRYG